MNRVVLTCVAASAATLVACSSSEVIVQAQLEGPDGQPVVLRELPIEALPYDRDLLFDSLGKAFDQPEPQVPADLMSLRDSIARAQDDWRTAENRWATVRDSLQRITQRLQSLNRASGEYVVLYSASAPLYEQESSLGRQKDQAFARFTGLQNRYTTRADSIKRDQEQWAEAAYADVGDVIAARLKEMRLEEVADTLDENGTTRIRGLKKGQWWIHARYDLPFEELYWNVPVTVTGGQVQVQLNRQTAQVRPKL